MPKAKVTNTTPQKTRSSVSRTPVKLNTSGTPIWYKVIMFGLMLLGLAWIVVFYLAAGMIPFMVELGAWNYAIGFGLFIVGLLMTMGWR
ncbi:cell division protein CrgA [Corynebacterium yudongzhengii]|uniref:Cell division protein CrgA n=1 Tax=Corynebacterium yudongzhengii TaxID=2080740 RepID=A0A2U1T548_9CORY|nr:cell division protein CrgA [Corynebacterium yudongzhengii]AWB80953.1 cell division protein CrgA [Corynebacterium yudongzhengii]PWC01121.1 cell division protein CrgA [Corynebacterium yudongzhengii]